jgi:low affinity Fe/Cu permease
VLWFVFDRASLDWHGVATLGVWFMTLLIQRTEHRDTQALQAKLDELLHAHSQANNALTKIDEAPWRFYLVPVMPLLAVFM